MYFVILGKNNTYCGTVPSSVYAKLINEFSFKVYEERFNFRVVKCNNANATKLKNKILVESGLHIKNEE